VNIVVDDKGIERRISAERLSRSMAKELAVEIAVEQSDYAQQRAEDDALIRYCRLSIDQIARLRAVRYTDKQRALQIAGRTAALLMLGEVCWLAADGDIQCGVMPDDEAGAQQSNIALAVGGIVADELLSSTPMPLAAVRGCTQLRYLDQCQQPRDSPAELFDCFRRYYAEQFLPHTAAIAALAEELHRTNLTCYDLAQFGTSWNLRARLIAKAA
jgi:hypothetical protein